MHEYAPTVQTFTFGYDANGNRLREQSSSSVTTYAYAPGSQRLSSRSGSVNETRSYDAAGNPTGVRDFATTYSVSGRLAQAGSTEYRYNGFGQRVYKNVGGVITRYVYDPAGNLLAEVDASGRTTREYVWLDEQPIAVLTPTTPGAATVRIDYIVPDHLGTPRLIIDSAGAVVWRWGSDPFGSTAPNEDPAGTGTPYVFNLRFPGQYFDAETGFSYNYMRMYEAGTGRYLESDPVGLDGGLNTYAYVGNNPLINVDPQGLFAGDPVEWVAAAKAVSTATGVAASAASAAIAGAAAVLYPTSLGDGTLYGDAANLNQESCNNNSDDECREILRKIDEVTKELFRRYMHQCRDKKGQWDSHLPAYDGKIRQLQKLVSRAERLGCKVPAKAYEWLNTPCPSPGSRAKPPNY